VGTASRRVDDAQRIVRLPLACRDSIGRAYHVLTFEAQEEIPGAPGQFAMVRGAAWGDSPLLPRPMSLLSSGRRPCILVKVVGEGSRRMACASPGELFDVLLPLGRPFSPCEAGSRPVLVAGGVGVAPLLFLAQKMAQSGVRPLALYGARTSADLPLDEELARVADVLVATEDGSRGHRGRVTELLESALRDAGPKTKVYTCGPERMMAKVAEICESVGASCEVSLETPMACGFGVCLGCAVKKKEGGYLYACVDGPCVDAGRIAWERG
jgi:dihydroorotate dehydrogenase electron transfer subunit